MKNIRKDFGMNKKQPKYKIYVTPKVYNQLKDLNLLPQDKNDIEIVSTDMVYMNMMGGWTEEECDSVVYLVPKETENE